MRRPLKTKLKIEPDHRYHSLKVSKFINQVMRQGKKDTARQIVYGVFDEIKKDAQTDPVETFEAALKNVGPALEVRSRRVGGANYQIPYEVRPERRLTLAMRWIIGAARSKTGTTMRRRLRDELVAASKNEGEAIKKRDTVHKMAEANRAFAHFAWTGRGKK